MRDLVTNLVGLAFLLAALSFPNVSGIRAEDYPDIPIRTILGKQVSLSSFEGQVLLIVNTASKCGYTSQYEGLENLFQRFKARGFSVLGFPSNDFGNQEPGSNEQIRDFCKSRFNITFPIFEKGPVTGDRAQPLFSYLTSQGEEKLTGSINWNFEKFLLDRSGRLRNRFRSSVSPESEEVVSSIEKLLAIPPTAN